MKFASWNVARKRSGILALVEHLDPDVAFIQECGDPESLKVPGYYVIGRAIDERGRSQNWGNAIVSKHPIAPVEIVSEYKGSMICASATMPDGSVLSLINLYGLLEPSPLKPEVKIVHYGVHRMLSDVGFWLAQLEGPKVESFIVGGDLNKDRRMDGGNGSKTGRSIASNLLNRFSDFGLIETDLGNAGTFTHSSSKSVWQIDHIFVSENLSKTVVAKVVDEDAILGHSDHSPIFLEFETLASGL